MYGQLVIIQTAESHPLFLPIAMTMCNLSHDLKVALLVKVKDPEERVTVSILIQDHLPCRPVWTNTHVLIQHVQSKIARVLFKSLVHFQR